MGLDNVAVQWPRTGRFYEPVPPAEFGDFAELAEAPATAGRDRGAGRSIARTGTVPASAYTELVDLLLGLEGVLYATDSAAEEEDPVIDPDGCAWIAGGLERFVTGHGPYGDIVTFETVAQVLRTALSGGRLAEKQLRWLESRLDALRDEDGSRPRVGFPLPRSTCWPGSTAAAPTGASRSTPGSDPRRGPGDRSAVGVAGAAAADPARPTAPGRRRRAVDDESGDDVVADLGGDLPQELPASSRSWVAQAVDSASRVSSPSSSLTGRQCGATSAPTTRSHAPNTVASAAGRCQPRPRPAGRAGCRTAADRADPARGRTQAPPPATPAASRGGVAGPRRVRPPAGPARRRARAASSMARASAGPPSAPASASGDDAPSAAGVAGRLRRIAGRAALQTRCTSPGRHLEPGPLQGGRHVGGDRAGHDDLAGAGESSRQPLAPAGVQLGEDVVEHQHRIDAIGAQQFVAGQPERQRVGPGLAVAGVALGRQVAEGEGQVVAVRPDEGHPALHLAGPGAGERVEQGPLQLGPAGGAGGSARRAAVGDGGTAGDRRYGVVAGRHVRGERGAPAPAGQRSAPRRAAARCASQTSSVDRSPPRCRRPCGPGRRCAAGRCAA